MATPSKKIKEIVVEEAAARVVVVAVIVAQLALGNPSRIRASDSTMSVIRAGKLKCSHESNRNGGFNGNRIISSTVRKLFEVLQCRNQRLRCWTYGHKAWDRCIVTYLFSLQIDLFDILSHESLNRQ